MPEVCAVCGTTTAVHWCEETGGDYTCVKHCPAWKWAINRG